MYSKDDSDEVRASNLESLYVEDEAKYQYEAALKELELGSYSLIDSRQRGSGRQNALNEKAYEVPEILLFHNVTFQLKAALLFCGSLNAGHYRSIVRVEDTWVKYDDDNVRELRTRTVMKDLKNNKYGWVYGLIYEKAQQA